MNTSGLTRILPGFVISVAGCAEPSLSNQPAEPGVTDEQQVQQPGADTPATDSTVTTTQSHQREGRAENDQQGRQPNPEQPDTLKPEDHFRDARDQMVDRHMAGRDITDPRVLSAMRHVPRHEFVPNELREMAYRDQPLPIGHEQTISQPYIVALMTQLVQPQADARALDIGTGSGYQAAVLGELVSEVHSIEIVRPLADSARERLERLGYTNVRVICGDGYRGLPDQAPFDVIIVAAAPDHVPEPLIQQLAPGGRLVIPVGKFFQELLVIEKLDDGSIRKQTVAPVRFVPMTGEAQQHND
jgi:protein-L-isoaspartate(D-aspartate) O-methyltransferase